MHSIEVLRITSPGIIAILIGLLLPAGQRVREATARQTSRTSPSALNKVREAAGYSIGSLNRKQPLPTTETGEILPSIERSLKFLQPYFAHRAQVEIRVANVAVGDVNGDGLRKLAQAFGAPVLIGRVGSNVVSWCGPVVKATPAGAVQKV